MLVTERDEVVAELRPARRQHPWPIASRSCSRRSRLRARSPGPRSRRATGPGAAVVWDCRRGRRRPCSTSCERSDPDRRHGRPAPLCISICRCAARDSRAGHDAGARAPNRCLAGARDLPLRARRGGACPGPGAASGRCAGEPARRRPTRARCALAALRTMGAEPRGLRPGICSSPPTGCCAPWMRYTWRLFSWPGGGSKGSSCSLRTGDWEEAASSA